MIPAVDIRHDLGRLSAELGLMAKEREAAALRALNRTMSTVRAESSRALAPEYSGLRIGAIKRRIKLSRASRASLRAMLDFSNRRLRLFNWRVTQSRAGVRGRLPGTILRVDAVSGRVQPIAAGDLRHAFIQRSRAYGTANVWLRQGKDRYPIDVLVAPSPSEVLVQKKINEALGRRARERFQVVFAQEAKFRLSKRG